MTVNAAIDTFFGSSPRERGKRASGGYLGRALGLIPAGAGKTGVINFQLATKKAHPRVSGENVIGLWNIARNIGSSPRERGKPRFCDRAIRESGLIPA